MGIEGSDVQPKEVAQQAFSPESQLIMFGNNPIMISHLRSLEEKDSQIEESVSVESLKKQVLYLNGLLYVKEMEIKNRDDQILDRDSQILDLTARLLKTYSSLRYKIGHKLVGPIERIYLLIIRK